MRQLVCFNKQIVGRGIPDYAKYNPDVINIELKVTCSTREHGLLFSACALNKHDVDLTWRHFLVDNPSIESLKHSWIRQNFQGNCLQSNWCAWPNNWYLLQLGNQLRRYHIRILQGFEMASSNRSLLKVT